MHRWRRIIDSRTFGLIQPDVCYTGGLCRALRIAAWSSSAPGAGIPCTPHNPHALPLAAPALHLIALLANPAPFHEHAPGPHIRAGRVAIPTDPGLGQGADEASFA